MLPLAATVFTMFSRQAAFVMFFSFAAGIAVTWGFFFVYKGCDNSGYPFIHPRTLCGDHAERSAVEFTAFRKGLETWIAGEKERGVVDDVAVFFRDVRNGPTFGINEQTEFSPGSLLKVPVMIAVLKEAEGKPSILEREIEIKGSIENTEQAIDPEKSLEDGKSYTVDQLLEKMIIYSDNRSKDILRNYLAFENPGEDPLLQTLYEVGIGTENYQLEDFLSVKSYSSFFRILYSASFLNREMSNWALELLSRTEFTHGLTQRLPTGVPVAHKFGIRGDLPNGKHQLHDCGIIYHPRMPYLLCVMTRGRDLDVMGRFIGDLSEKVYGEIERRTQQ